MLLREIHIRNFRKLVAPLVIKGLKEGLTVIVGDNEEGKSTLLDAIRTGLFERHNLSGEGLARMQPFDSRLRPEIRLDFGIDGRAYCLIKAFGQRPEARLEVPNGIPFEGPEAEEELAKLLTFRMAQRGESKPDDRGVLGLFWLEQGRSLERLSFGETGRSTLRAAFEEEVGDVLGGARSRRLMGAAKATRDALLTATGRPKAGGNLAQALAEAQDTIRRVQQLEVDCREYDRDIDELGRVQGELAQIDAERGVEKAQHALAEAEADAKRIEELRQSDAAAAGAVALAGADFRNANDRWAGRETLVEASQGRTAALTATRSALTSLDARTEEVARVFEEAKTALDRADAAKNRAEARLALSEMRNRRELLDEEIAGLDRQISKVDGLMTTRAAAVDQLATIRIDEPELEEIERQNSAIREARAAIAIAATRLRFFPLRRQAITNDGMELTPGEAVDVAERTRFTLEGFGTIEVEPGGSVLVESRDQLKEAEAALSWALVVAEVADVAEARTKFAARKDAEADIRRVNELIAVHTPQGFEALRSARQEKFTERASLDVALDGVCAWPDLADPETERRTLDNAERSETTAREALNEAQGNLQEHSTKLAVARANFENAQRNSAEAIQELDAARLETPDIELTATLSAVTSARAGAERAKADTARELAAAKPDEVEHRRQRAQGNLGAIEAKWRELEKRNIALESSLSALDKRRIREDLEEAREQEARAVSRRDRVQAEADAWKLLLDTLESAERDAKRAFLGPVLQRVQPFLDLLFPSMGVTLEEDTLEITKIDRDGRTEPYWALSIGTREQLSILVRLAFAVYLREKGYPAAVILDDALVYADDDRFERMQLALRKAAETVQILILTCRPRDWRQFGAPIRRLADAVTAFEPA